MLNTGTFQLQTTNDLTLNPSTPPSETLIADFIAISFSSYSYKGSLKVAKIACSFDNLLCLVLVPDTEHIPPL